MLCMGETRSRLDVERQRNTGDPQQPGQQECLTSLLPFAIRGARQVIPLCTAVNVTSTDPVYACRRNECAVSGQIQETVNIVDKATTYLHPFMKTTDVGWL